MFFHFALPAISPSAINHQSAIDYFSHNFTLSYLLTFYLLTFLANIFLTSSLVMAEVVINSFTYFHYLPRYQVLYCSATSCQYCLIPGKGLHRHFSHEHGITGQQKKQLLSWVEMLELIEP